MRPVLSFAELAEKNLRNNAFCHVHDPREDVMARNLEWRRHRGRHAFRVLGRHVGRWA